MTSLLCVCLLAKCCVKVNSYTGRCSLYFFTAMTTTDKYCNKLLRIESDRFIIKYCLLFLPFLSSFSLLHGQLLSYYTKSIVKIAPAKNIPAILFIVSLSRANRNTADDITNTVIPKWVLDSEGLTSRLLLFCLWYSSLSVYFLILLLRFLVPQFCCKYCWICYNKLYKSPYEYFNRVWSICIVVHVVILLFLSFIIITIATTLHSSDA